MTEPTTEAGRRHWGNHWNAPEELDAILAIEAESRADPIPATTGCPCDTCERLRIRALAENR